MRGWDDEIDILSAENVSFAIEPAGLGSRLGAALIDLTIQALVGTLLILGATWVIDYIAALLATAGKWMEAIGAALLILVGAILIYGYYFLFEWLWDGQTPGKRWLGLRTVQMNGLPISAWEALVRSILRTLDFLPLMYGLGGFIAVLNPHNRRIGDLVAGTVVVRERHEATQQILDIDAAADAFLAAQTSGAQTSPATQNDVAKTTEYSEERALLSRLTDEDRELLHEFLNRNKTAKSEVKGAARERLASSLAMRLAARMEQPLPAPNQAEAFLEAVASAIRRVD